MLELINFVYASQIVDAQGEAVFTLVHKVVPRKHEHTEPKRDLAPLFC